MRHSKPLIAYTKCSSIEIEDVVLGHIPNEDFEFLIWAKFYSKNSHIYQLACLNKPSPFLQLLQFLQL